jgi:phosphosulfolactate synthase
MNYVLKNIPPRPVKPRENGLTMVMDKGLGLKEAELFVDSSAHLTDVIKLGFGTSYISNNLKEKIKLYKQAGLKVYVGGTLFEAFIVRNMFDDYQKLIDDSRLIFVFSKVSVFVRI